MKRIIYGIICCFFCFSLLIGCSSNSGGVQSKYQKATIEAAQTMLKNEVKDYTWTTVKTGELQYMHTEYNEDLEEYRTYYYAEFDEADIPEDQWIVIEIYTIGDELSVTNAECSYADATYYEQSLKHSQVTGTHDMDGTWNKVD